MVPTVLAVLALAGCGVHATGVDVWAHYQAFERELSLPTGEQNYSAYLSEKILSELASAQTPEERRSLVAQVEFPRWLGEVSSHHQVALDDGNVCLTVNGRLATHESFGSVALEYIVENGRHVVAGIHYQYLDGPHEFGDSAKCPADFTPEFPP